MNSPQEDSVNEVPSWKDMTEEVFKAIIIKNKHLEAEIQRLSNSAQFRRVEMQQEEIASLRSILKEMVGALKKYGKHNFLGDLCQASDGQSKCTCGFKEALAKEKGIE